MGFDKPMYRITFRILESLDEHFYEIEQFSYHWSLNGIGLSDAILKQVYHDNAAKLLASRGAQPGSNRQSRINVLQSPHGQLGPANAGS
jgi:hypothetical protein